MQQFIFHNHIIVNLEEPRTAFWVVTNLYQFPSNFEELLEGEIVLFGVNQLEKAQVQVFEFLISMIQYVAIMAQINQIYIDHIIYILTSFGPFWSFSRSIESFIIIICHQAKLMINS